MEKVQAEIGRKGKTMPYTSLNGHMYSLVTKEGELAIRLPKEARVKFINQYNTKLAESYGAILKEYVVIPDELLTDIDKLKDPMQISKSYIRTLKPKPASKKRSPDQ